MTANDQTIEVGFLNVVATPHPAGVYSSLLKKAALKPINFFGDHFALINSVAKVEGAEALYRGRLYIWTEINKDEPAINKIKLEEISHADLQLEIPDDIGFNSKSFNFFLNEATHVLTVEVKNELQKSISIRRVGKIFSSLLSAEIIGLDSPSVEVTIIPDDDALDRVLSLPNLSKIQIVVLRPNEDDISKATGEILKELDDMKAKRLEIEIVREAGEKSIVLNNRYMKYAQVAAENGHVSTKGKGADHEAISASTKEHPRILKKAIDTTLSFSAALRSIAESTRNKISSS